MKRSRFTWQVTTRLRISRDVNVNFRQLIHAALHSGRACLRAEAPTFSWSQLVSEIEAVSDPPSYFPVGRRRRQPNLVALRRSMFPVLSNRYLSPPSASCSP